MLFDTIAAIATGNQTSAISIIRVSGDKTIEIVESIFSKNLSDVKGNTIVHGNIIDPIDKKVIDEVVVLLFRNPHSYTGEDLIEIDCHGGSYVTRRILSVLLSRGCRLAQRGEFTQRAYLNGKVDLTQAEAVNDLINANHDDQLTLANNELQGSIRKLLDPLLDEMVTTIGNIEVNIDYPEYEDIQQLTDEMVLPKVNKWINEIDKMIEQSNRGKIVKEGVLTAIVGKTNVGKSSLLNALLEEDKAIVTDIPGTTRDIVEGDVRLKNITLHLLDTAGIRETDDKVENIGITKSKEVIEKAELIILVIDDSRQIDNEDRELLELTKDRNTIVVYNKSDLSTNTEGLHISAKNGDIEQLINRINEMYQEVHENVSKPTFSNERQIGLLKEALQAFRDAKEGIESSLELDLVLIDIHHGHDCLREIIGTYTKEDLLDDIFSRFCLGK